MTGAQEQHRPQPLSTQTGHTDVHPAWCDPTRCTADSARQITSTVIVAFKKPKNGDLTDLQQAFNSAHNRLRAVGERGNSLLKTRFKALRNISLDPWRIGDIVAAALVVLHLDPARTA